MCGRFCARTRILKGEKMYKKYIALWIFVSLLLSCAFALPVGAADLGHEVLQNGSFASVETDSESADYGRPSPWSSGRGWTGDVKVVMDTENNRYVSMTRPEGDTGYMSIIQTNRAVDPGATYNLQIKYKADEGTSPLVTVVYRDASQKSIDSISVNLSPGGEWKTANISFTASHEEGTATHYVNVELRALGNTAGTILWDDVSCVKTKYAPAAILETDEKFYYADVETGTATLKATGLEALPSDAAVDFQLKNESGVVVEEVENVAFSTGEAAFTFSVSAFTKKETYTVCYTLRGDGETIETGEETVYRYDRPSMITEDGKIELDGKPFLPVMGYHVQTNNTSDYEYCQKVGINVIQFFPWTTNPDAIKQRLDLLGTYNLKAFVALYGTADDKAADVVKASKDHPATFGYMLMDEPLHNGILEERLELLYKAVRDNDDVHPAYVVESMAKSEKYEISAKYCDIFATDPYPGSVERAGTYPTYGIELAKAAAGQNKPIMCITQCFPLSGYEPDGEAVRNMLYQALMSGAAGIGYYDLRDSAGYNDGEAYHAWERDCWLDMISFAENELDFAYNAFIGGAYEKLSDVKTDTTWYQTFRVGESVRCIAINRTNTVQTVEIPITGPYGSAHVLAGTEATAPELINGKLTVSISPLGALVLEPTVGDLTFLSDGKETKTLTSGTVTARYSIYSTTSQAFTVYMALYQKGSSAEAESVQVSEKCTVSAGETASVSLDMNIDSPENRYIKVFVWGSGLCPTDRIFELGA